MICDIRVEKDKDQIVRMDGAIIDEIDYWTVRWTEKRPGYIAQDYARSFGDEDEAISWEAHLLTQM